MSKSFASLLLVPLLLLGLAGRPAHAEARHARADAAEVVLHRYVDYINQKNWPAFAGLWSAGLQPMWSSFFGSGDNRNNHVGVLGIKRAKLVGYHEVPKAFGLNFVGNGTGRCLETPGAESRFFYTAIRYDVFNESKYMLNGINYVFLVLVKENGHWRVCQCSVAPAAHFIEGGYGFGTADERSYDERRMRFAR
ncbi:hypothetical protein SAMN02799624_02158 [Paenibacillus sp. UNC496MF]|uniref:hypothetical protein n=1 Tax=Paenibacillus sp. UNC496MF TaxID=1502753 RepID=UPI0008EE227B|nr:hypothetical protein [Paenibacillus sp. UNC496MF]SFI78220.1 hypothetical protein SAMN02799624_02158 [Paenibacillus sp. UNC496MF]